jgi:hypothetical protein
MSKETFRTKSKLPLRRWLLLALWTFIVGYVLIVAVFALFQRQLLYVPTKLSLAEAEQWAAKTDFVSWRNKSGKLIGWKLSASSAPTGSVLIVHGNGGWALNRADMAKPIHDAAPVDIYILEYPGYGARDGSPGEKSFLLAADEAFEGLPKNMPIYVVSESLGTGVAAHLAQKNSLAVSGLAMFVPYNKLASVAQNHLPFLPAYFLLWDRFDPAAWLKDYHGPIKFIVAGSDEIIPPILGRRLYDGYNGPKILEVIPGAHHNDTAEQSPAWWKEVFSFWRQNEMPKR